MGTDGAAAESKGAEAPAAKNAVQAAVQALAQKAVAAPPAADGAKATASAESAAADAAPAAVPDAAPAAAPARPSARVLAEVAQREKALREREARAKTQADEAKKALEEAKALKEQAARLDALRAKVKADPWGTLRDLGVSDDDVKTVFGELTRGAMAGGRTTPEAEIAKLRKEIEEKERRGREEREAAVRSHEEAVQTELETYFAGIDQYVSENAQSYPLTATVGRGTLKAAAVEYARSHGGVAATPEELAPLVEKDAEEYLEQALAPTPWFKAKIDAAVAKALSEREAQTAAAAKAAKPVPKTTAVPNSAAALAGTAPAVAPRSQREAVRAAVEAVKARRAESGR